MVSQTQLRIGLCLSGGGYRAAAFHLGTMSYLQRCKLLPNLIALSTSSGGTIVGAKYIHSQIAGQQFADFFRDFYEFLAGKSLLQRCFEALGNKSPDVPSGRVDAIISLAQAYQSALFTKDDGQPLLFQDVLASGIPVREVIFNATEFRSGQPFRFRRSANRNIAQGSQNVAVATEYCESVRVADIVASSSCFPVGFEPIAFPDDFSWSNGVVPKRLRDLFMNGVEKTPVALMDGGLGDNQGIDALREATDSWRQIDYLVISDSDRHDDDLYPFPSIPDPGLTYALTLGTINVILNLVALIWAFTVIVVGLRAYTQFRAGQSSFVWDLFLYVVPLSLATTSFLALRMFQRVIRDEILSRIPGLGLKAWVYLKKLSLRDFLYMLLLRQSSFSVIANSIFMNRIRDLIYREIDTDDDIRTRVIKCQLNDLLSPSRDVSAETVRSSAKLCHAVKLASTMPTTIWFSNDTELPSLVVCGQSTLCHNLRRFLRDKYGPDESAYPDDVKALFEQLESDWPRFLEQPQFLLDELCDKLNDPGNSAFGK